MKGTRTTLLASYIETSQMKQPPEVFYKKTVRVHPFSTHAKYSCVCAYLGVRNIGFSEIVAFILKK